MTPALFLDRDGTIIFDKHHIHNPGDVRLVPGVREALKASLEAGYKLFILTNQSGIGRGYFTWDDYQACNTRMIELLGLGKEVFTEIKAAPEIPGVPSLYRKPDPRFINEMVAKYRLAGSASWMIGDRQSDWECGLNAGIKSAAVRTGKPIEPEDASYLQKSEIPVFDDLPAFIRGELQLAW
ncbi:MAG: HAD-IIIA family hydrolase [Puniceicoccales bacterium]|jgi:histidinol-phosphate phosphatase family protein|nr:HAD-IIIA family hydrolase [Puniceicoccales bacterium]